MTERRHALRLLLLASLLLTLALSFASCSGDTTGSTDPPPDPPASKTVDVPDVTDEPAADGKSQIEEAGPDLTVEYAEEPEDEANCTVSEQDETGEVEPDTTVILTLECQVEVPDVLDEPATDAKETIEAVEGLTASYDTEPEDASLCTVSDQDLAGGEMADPDTEVTLTLDCEVKVPDVVGMSAADGKSAIEDTSDLTASYDTEPEDESLCTVESQDPAGDETAEAGSDVTLTLACGGDDVPLGASDPEIETPEPGSSDYDSPSTPGSPTTEDFGSGKGRTGLCNDGTLSRSIGRPGACSHHGGVQ